MTRTTVTSPDGTALAVRRSGSGSPIVLVHGALANMDDFVMAEAALAQHHSVWVYSRRGRGGSGDGSGYDLEREVDDVLAVVEAAGEPAHVLGHSSGALYCLLAAARAAVRSLTLYEPPLHANRLDPALRERVTSAVDAGDLDGAIEAFLPVVGVAQEEINAMRCRAEVWEALREGVRVFPREMRALMAVAPARFAAAGLPDVPMLYLYGEHTDAAVYPGLDEIAMLLPNARLHCLPGQRHLASAFDPALFAKSVLDFTTTHDN